MKIIDRLQNVLLEYPRFLNEEGTLLKARVHDAATSLDPNLLAALLADPDLKSHFFRAVGDVTVFDQDKFMWVVNSKEFLPDSYTAYRNKIGLSSNDRDLLQSSSEVSLVWPFKDCVLEGCQDKEDEKRDEIFYNETLAPDEVERLLAPKALKNAVRHSVDGTDTVTELNAGDNLLIKGNNLLALSSLLERFEGQVQCIYIDPPYYFQGNVGDTFAYNSDFKMSTWLTFMKNRLEIARRLLKPGGTIWIQISEDGMHYLKVLCDSIFGADHFIGTLPRRTRSAKSDVPFNFSQDFDFVLAYTNVDKGRAPIGRTVQRRYYETDDYPGRPWRLADLTTQRSATERPNSFFTMIDPKTGRAFPASTKRTWAVTKDTFEDYYKSGAIVFPDDYDFLNIKTPYARKFKDDDEHSGKLSAVVSDIQIQDFLTVLLSGSKNTRGNTQMKDLLDTHTFSYPKPEELIEAILEVSTQPGDLVLDFFLGSGTTAAVAHKMGRRYIGVEQMGYIDDVTIPRLEKVLAGEQGGISKSQNWHGGGSFVSIDLAERSNLLMNTLHDAQDSNSVQAILDQVTEDGLLRPSVLPDDIINTQNSMASLSLEEQKRIVAELIDKNRLYINADEIEDTTLGLTGNDITFTRSFYGMEQA